MEQQVKEFYSQLKFPGLYTIDDLKFYDEHMVNKYLTIFDDAIKQSTRVLDVGCGSGFIVNLFARKYPTVKFDAIDFSDSIDYAKELSLENKINNINYYKENFLDWNSKKTYDLVISNGVIHHMPEYKLALKKIEKLSSDKVILGIYNSYGKLMKKFKSVAYTNATLYADQELCPFETSFSDKEFKQLVSGYRIVRVHPSYNNRLVDWYNLFNYANGGLTIYLLKK
jgi:trans-aconitate methyltransferase